MILGNNRLGISFDQTHMLDLAVYVLEDTLATLHLLHRSHTVAGRLLVSHIGELGLAQYRNTLIASTHVLPSSQQA